MTKQYNQSKMYLEEALKLQLPNDKTNLFQALGRTCQEANQDA